MEPDDALVPFDQLPASLVPKAGSEELKEHRRSTGDRRTNFALFGTLSLVFGLLLAASMAPGVPMFVAAILALFTAAASATTLASFLGLMTAPKLYMVLPDGATTASAELEDQTMKLLREWNADIKVWNRTLRDWRSETREWQFWRDHPAKRPVEWSEAFHEERRQSLAALADALYHERAGLLARRRDIANRLQRLEPHARSLPAAREPKLLRPPDDPEKK